MKVTLLAMLALIAVCGCSAQESTDSLAAAKPTEESTAKRGQNDNEKTDDPNKQISNEPVKREDLDRWIAELGDESDWHYDERTEGELIGTWVAEDGSGNRLVFGKDGSFREDFNGELTTGLFAISDKGRIAAISTLNDVGLQSHFRFDGVVIVGPKGPNPQMRWRRVKPGSKTD